MSLSWFILNPIHSFFSFAHGDEQGRLSKLFGAQWHFHLEWSFPLVPLKTLNIQGWIPTIVLASAAAAAVAAESLQSSPTLWDPIDGSPPGSPVPGSLQARTLEWVAIAFSNAWKCKVKVKSLSRVRLFATPWPAAYQAPPSMGFSRQEYWSGVPSPSPLASARGHYFE